MSHTYSFQWKDHQQGGDQWDNPRAFLFRGNETVNPQDLRHDWNLENGGNIHRFPNSSWHCSWCFPDTTKFINKLNAYSHSEELQNEENFDPAEIVEKVRRGQWL